MAEGKDEVIRKMAALKDGFKAGLDDRLRELRAAFDGLMPDDDAGQTARSLETLHGLCHKLRGAAGTFGFAATSEIAGQLDDLTQDLLDQGRLLDDGDRQALRRLFSSLQAASAGHDGLSISDAAAWESLVTARESAGDAPTAVILVDDDESFLELVRNQLSHFGFDVLALADHAELRSAVVATPPAAVIMDVAFPGDDDAGVTTIRALRDEGILSCPVVFLSVRGDLPARLGAVRAGCDGYLVKPVDLAELVELLDRLTKRVREEAFRVVVVDDDPPVAEFNAALLAQAGMETAVVTDPMKAMGSIHEMRPDVILMDIQMPECDGIELAQVIRQDKAFVQTPIVFLTGGDVEDAWLQAMQAGGDEFLRKTIEPKELLASVLGRARRARDLGLLLTRLEQSHSRFRAVAESAQEAIITADAKGRIVYWNGGAQKAFGYQNTEVLGLPISTLIPQALRQGHETEYQEEASEKEVKTGDKTIEAFGLRKDGGEFPIEISSADWRLGNQVHITSIIRDISDRKQAEEALRESEETLRAINDTVSAGILVISIEDGSIVFANAEAHIILGDGLEKLFGRDWNDIFVDPQDRQNLLLQFSGEGAVKNKELRIRRTDGKPAWILISLTGVSTHDLNVLLVSFIDISERKKTEAELKKLSSAVEHSPAIVMITDPEGCIEYVNPRFVETSGYSADEMIGGNPRLLKSGGTSPEEYQRMWQTISSGQLWQGEFQNRRKDGSEYWISASIAPVTDAARTITHYVAVQEDISERKASETALEEKQKLIELLNAVTTIANEAALPDDALRRTLMAVCKYADWPVGHVYRRCADNSDKLVPSDLWYLREPERFTAFRDITERTEFKRGEGLPGRVLESGRPVWIEDVSVDPNFPRARLAKDIGVRGAFALPVLAGSDVVAVLEFFTPEVRTVHNPDLESALIHIGIQLGRVVERSVFQDNLHQAKEEAETANRAKSEFLSAMSHDLRTPLNSILGFSQVLRSDPEAPLSEDQDDSVAHIAKAGTHLLGLINEVLELSRIESGTFTMSLEALDPVAVVGECLDLVRPLAKDRDIVVKTQLDGDLPGIKADYSRLKDVLLNLLSNAIKYNREQGEVSVSCRPAPGRRLRLAVADSGPGIPKQRLPELFLPFSRLGAESSEIEGAGIGLTIVKRLVELMDGEIGVESKVGEGSVFWVELPLAAKPSHDSDDRGETGIAPLASGTASHTVLYVEDNPANLHLMRKIIARRRNCSLIEAASGEAGLDLAARERPDIVIMDVNLPGIDGFEALRRLRQSEAGKDLPVIALSANAMPKTVKRGLAAGFCAYLTKPVDVPELMNVLDAALKDTA